MAETTASEVSTDRQLVDAQTAVKHASDMLFAAFQAEQATQGQYDLARLGDPADQSTDHARHAWAQALADWVDARVVLARAQDELNAIHRQARLEREGAEVARG